MIEQGSREEPARGALSGFLLGAVVALVLAGVGIAGAASRSERADDVPMEKSAAYCKVKGNCGDGVYEEPTIERPKVLDRFETGAPVTLSPAEVSRVEDIVGASSCVVAAPLARTVDEADALGRESLESPPDALAEKVRGYWAEASISTLVSDVLAGQVISDQIGRHTPIACELAGFRVVSAVGDSDGLVVEVRYQIRRKFPMDSKGMPNIAPSDDAGWENANSALEYSYLLELTREDQNAQWFATATTFYRDPKFSDSGI